MQSAGIAGPAKSWSRVQRFGRRGIQGGRGLRHPGGGVRTSGQESDDVVGLSTGDSRRSIILSRVATLPPFSIMAHSNSSHSGCLHWMPRSRQISAMTAPMGRRLISAAIHSGVGRLTRLGCSLGGGAAGAARGVRVVRGEDVPCGRGSASRRPAVRISLASRAWARSRPPVMWAMISAMSAVPKLAA
jgi:hypothetical protein